MIRSISEILNMAHQAETKEAKITILRENVSQALTTILLGAFDDRVEWLLPHGLVPFKVMPDGSDQEGRLYQESKKLYMFIKDGGAEVAQIKREMLFIQLLETLDRKDAFLMVAVKDKKLPYSTITRDLVDEAFPKMLHIEGRPIYQEPTQDDPAPIEEPPVEAKKVVAKKKRRGRPPKKKLLDQDRLESSKESV